MLIISLVLRSKVLTHVQVEGDFSDWFLGLERLTYTQVNMVYKDKIKLTKTMTIFQFVHFRHKNIIELLTNHLSSNTGIN